VTVRKITVDCTVALEVTVQVDGHKIDILDVAPLWDRLEVGLSYWLPGHRLTNVGTHAAINDTITKQLPTWCELRLHRK
jgi:hypothetical protein